MYSLDFFTELWAAARQHLLSPLHTPKIQILNSLFLSLEIKLRFFRGTAEYLRKSCSLSSRKLDIKLIRLIWCVELHEKHCQTSDYKLLEDSVWLNIINISIPKRESLSSSDALQMFLHRHSWRELWHLLKIAIFHWTPREFLKHAIPDDLVKGTHLFSLWLSNKKLTTANTSIAFQCEGIEVIPMFLQISKRYIWCATEF